MPVLKSRVVGTSERPPSAATPQLQLSLAAILREINMASSTTAPPGGGGGVGMGVGAVATNKEEPAWADPQSGTGSGGVKCW